MQRRGVWCAGVMCALMAAGGLGGCVASDPSRITMKGGDLDLFSPSIADLINQTNAHLPAEAAPEPQVVHQGDKDILIYPARHARPEALREAIAGLLNPDGTVQDSAPLNTLVIEDHPDTVAGILAVLESLDHPTSQLLVEARIVEVTVNDDLEYEIQHTLTVPSSPGSFFQNAEVTLQTPTAAPTGTQGLQLTVRPFGSGDKTLENFVKLLETKGKANILSAPNLIVAPGTEASIITGEEVPIESSTVVAGSLSTNTVFKRVGIKLRVALLQITNDTARLDINPEVSTVTGSAAGSDGVSNPIISLRNVSSTLSLKDGEILTIGGLMDNEDRVTTMGIPVLQDIPWAGVLFKSISHQKVKTQLIFFLRVHILPAGAADALRLHKPGAGFEVIEGTPRALVPGTALVPGAPGAPAQTQPAASRPAAALSPIYVNPVVATQPAMTQPALTRPATLPAGGVK